MRLSRSFRTYSLPPYTQNDVISGSSCYIHMAPVPQACRSLREREPTIALLAKVFGPWLNPFPIDLLPIRPDTPLHEQLPCPDFE